MRMRVVLAVTLVAASATGCAGDAARHPTDPARAPASSELTSRPETPADAGCNQDGVFFYPLPPSIRDTEHDALDAMVADSYPAGTRTYEVHRLVGGYQHAESGYGFVLFRDGRAVATGGISRERDGWSAQIAGSCAERNGPVTEPLPPTPSADGPPTTLRVICTPSGVEVATPRVRTSPNGVDVVVTNNSGLDDPDLVYGRDGTVHGGDRLSYTGLSPLALPPGKWQLGCAAHMATDALSGEVTVVDPDHNWRPPRLQADCPPAGNFYALPGYGTTEQAAIASVVERFQQDPLTRTRLYDDGYWRRPGHDLVIRLHGASGFIDGATSHDPDGAGWTAHMHGTCRPV